MSNPVTVELRSDTFTLPTEKMRLAMRDAECGDDVVGEDPTINRLQELAASLTGKESALFVPSGTFGNQLAIMTHTSRGNEVILSEKVHVIEHEAGAAALLSGVQMRSVAPSKAYLCLEDIIPRVRTVDDIHIPRTGLICLENALADGTVMPVAEMARIKAYADTRGIPVHLDGARLFNAALALGVPASAIAHEVTSVMFCLSKGLGAPVGSMLCGPAAFIEKARKLRKILGGGMRKVGILGAAGIVALTDGVARLNEDHVRAQRLAKALGEMHPLLSVVGEVQTNMVFVRVQDETGRYSTAGLIEHLLVHRVLVYRLDSPFVPCRFVTSSRVDDADIDRAIAVVRGYFAAQ